MKCCQLLLFLLLISSALFSQKQNSTKKVFSGNLIEDSRIALETFERIKTPVKISTEKQKSVVLAGIFSAMVPGAGELYAENYWKGAAFFAAEITALTANLYFNKKGDDNKLEVQRILTIDAPNFADEHWSPVRYAEWLNKYAAELGAMNAPKIQINYSSNLKPWQQVDFNQIHAIEDKIPSFTHRLENYGEQEYYALISNFTQYSHGWDQSNPNTSEYKNKPQVMLDFFNMLNVKVDDNYYNYAKIAIGVVFTNHILSVIDAIWSTHSYNQNLSFKIRMEQCDLAGFTYIHPVANLQLRF